MKYVRQFVIIMLFTFLGEVLKALLPFPVPASIYGLLALLIALETKLLPLASVRDVGEFFVEIMPLTFIPAGVGLLESWGVMKPMLGSLVNPLPFAHGEAATPPERKRTEAKTNSAIEIYREIIKDNIDYDILIQDPKMDKDRLDEIVEIMLETVCTARKTIRIAGDDYPAELVKSKFMKLNSSHVEFVLDCMRENTTKIRNIKQYLKAVLFNAPSTIDSYYTALVNHDFYGSK